LPLFACDGRKKFSRKIGDKKNKELLTKKSNDKKLGKKRENGAFAPWSPRPGRRTITLFYTFICEKVWYYPLYTNIRALI